MKRFDRLRKLARNFAIKQGHELGVFKPADRVVQIPTTTGGQYVISNIYSGSTVSGGVITLTMDTWTISSNNTSATTSATIAPIAPSSATITQTSPYLSPSTGSMLAGTWFRSYCILCGLECWLNEMIDPNKFFLHSGTDKNLYNGIKTAKDLNELAEQDGQKWPFPKRARGLIFGPVFGEQCSHNPKLLACGDSTD